MNLKNFYKTIWKPWADKNNFKPNPWHWRMHIPDNYKEWIATYHKQKNNPYTYWEDYYDSTIVPYLKRKK